MVYLKQTIRLEPLIWGWYAWPHLIAPHTASGNIVDRHLRIMESYIHNPKIHAKAASDPKLIGGPFIDYEEIHLDKIKELIHYTKEECNFLIDLNFSIKEINRQLQSQAIGDSLESLYNIVPHNLKGLIEIAYSIYHHPIVRFIEPFIYKRYYSDKNQTIVLSDNANDYRKFVLSTPRLKNSNEIHLPLPFSSKLIDKLFQMKDEAGNLEKMKRDLNISLEDEPLFFSFFTASSPFKNNDKNYYEEGIRLRYFGHACMLIQTKNLNILFDPVISYQVKETTVPRYTFADLPDQIDYVVITHNHQDHLMFESLLQIRHKIKNIIFPSSNRGAIEDPSIKLILQHMGFDSLIELEETGTVELRDGQIIGLPFLGEHGDLNIHSKLSYCVKLKGKTFMFAADSNNLDPCLYDYIFQYTGAISMLFLGMECEGAPLTWLYGPILGAPISRSFDRNRSLSGSNFEKAWFMVEKLKCQNVCIYAMGQEPWLKHIMAINYSTNSLPMVESDKLIKMCNDKGIYAKRLFGKDEWILE